jgi:hypothetical protein
VARTAILREAAERTAADPGTAPTNGASPATTAGTGVDGLPAPTAAPGRPAPAGPIPSSTAGPAEPVAPAEDTLARLQEAKRRTRG